MGEITSLKAISFSHQNPDDGDGDGSRNVGFFQNQLTRLIAQEVDFSHTSFILLIIIVIKSRGMERSWWTYKVNTEF
jgi:hypothetical protein